MYKRQKEKVAGVRPVPERSSQLTPVTRVAGRDEDLLREIESDWLRSPDQLLFNILPRSSHIDGGRGIVVEQEVAQYEDVGNNTPTMMDITEENGEKILGTFSMFEILTTVKRYENQTKPCRDPEMLSAKSGVKVVFWLNIVLTLSVGIEVLGIGLAQVFKILGDQIGIDTESFIVAPFVIVIGRNDDQTGHQNDMGLKNIKLTASTSAVSLLTVVARDIRLARLVINH